MKGVYKNKKYIKKSEADFRDILSQELASLIDFVENSLFFRLLKKIKNMF